MQPTNFLTATETRQQLKDGIITISQILKDHQARYENRDDEVRAWVVARHQGLIEEVEEKGNIDVGENVKQTLAGITIGVKDIITTKDMPTKYGSEIYRDSNQLGLDASMVAICREQGALILGKTVTTEFACGSDIPKTNNPHDITRTTGYSSAGSAAAVADYQCHVALGTQTIMSIAEPASFNGILGYKPTWSRIDMNGIKITSPSLDTIGFFARCIPDLQILAKVFGIESQPLGSDARAINSCKFAFVKTDQFKQYASEDLQLVWELAQTILIEAGAEVVDVDLDNEYDNMGNSYEICDEQVATSLLAEHRTNPDKLSAGLQKMVKTGGGISHTQAQVHRDHIAALRPKFDKLASEYDAIITPSCAGEAPEKEDFDPETKFCGLWTALHVPVIAVPGFTGSNGLPIGLSLVGPRYGDEKLLQVAGLVAQVFGEKGTRWPRKVSIA